MRVAIVEGVALVDGKMLDDATWKQAKVIVDLAKLGALKIIF